MLLSENETKAMKIINDLKMPTENIIYIRDCRNFEMVAVYVADGGVIGCYDVYDDGYISYTMLAPTGNYEVKRRYSDYD